MCKRRLQYDVAVNVVVCTNHAVFCSFIFGLEVGSAIYQVDSNIGAQLGYPNM